jgi:hypothetical protein
MQLDRIGNAEAELKWGNDHAKPLFAMGGVHEAAAHPECTFQAAQNVACKVSATRTTATSYLAHTLSVSNESMTPVFLAILSRLPQLESAHRHQAL